MKAHPPIIDVFWDGTKLMMLLKRCFENESHGSCIITFSPSSHIPTIHRGQLDFISTTFWNPFYFIQDTIPNASLSTLNQGTPSTVNGECNHRLVPIMEKKDNLKDRLGCACVRECLQQSVVVKSMQNKTKSCRTMFRLILPFIINTKQNKFMLYYALAYITLNPHVLCTVFCTACTLFCFVLVQ